MHLYVTGTEKKSFKRKWLVEKLEKSLQYQINFLVFSKYQSFPLHIIYTVLISIVILYLHEI